MLTPVISFRSIAKQFGAVTALSDVTFDVAAGEVVGLLGENGAGKSTLLRMMSGELQPDGGSVTIDRGERARPGRSGSDGGITVVHQEPEIFPTLSVAENLLLPRLGKGESSSVFVRRSGLSRQARQVLADVGFGEDLDPDRLAGELTPGGRQVLEIARALATNPRVLALDEPTASLSERESERLFALVDRLRAAGVAIIYVTHRLKELDRLCDRVVVLRDGRVVADRRRADYEPDEMVRLMVGRERLALERKGMTRDRGTGLRVTDLWTDQLRSITIQVRAGEVVGLGGLIGAGRSELARAISGLDPRTRGTIEVGGREIAARTVPQAHRAGIFLIPEDRKVQGLLMDRSIRENVSLSSPGQYSRAGWISGRGETRLARRWIDELRIRCSGPGQLVSELSGGNQQKVVLARALATGPKVLILDEPTKGVDVGARAEIYRIIDEFAQSGMAVLFISSELPELMAVSDRILMMADGAITGEVDRVDASEERLLRMVLAPTTG